MMSRLFIIILLLVFVSLFSCIIDPAVEAAGTPGDLNGTVFPFYIEEKLSSLENLPVLDFIDQSYLAVVSCYPESVTIWGLDDELGMDGRSLNSYDAEYVEKIYRYHKGVRNLAEKYNVETLSDRETQELSLYRYYLSFTEPEWDYRYHRYRLSYSRRDSINYSSTLFFLKAQPLKSEEDAEDYIARLWNMKKKMEELDAFIEEQEKAGIVLPERLTGITMSQLRYFSRTEVRDSPLYKDFSTRLRALNLDENRENSLLEEAETAIEESVKEGFQLLEDRLISQYDKAPDALGSKSLPRGEEYYRYLLKETTWTTKSTDELIAIASSDLEEINREMYAIFEELEYDTEKSLVELFDLLNLYGPTVSGAEVLDEHGRLIDDSLKWIEDLFHSIPEEDVLVKEDDSPGLYVVSSLDGERKAAFYTRAKMKPYFEVPNLTFHEVYPGHHYQQALHREMNLSLFRTHFQPRGYIEGWAVYAEDLMDRSGYYKEDPHGRLGMLFLKALRAAYLITDISLNLKDWSLMEATDFLVQKVGFDKIEANRIVSSQLVSPARLAAYYTGYIEFREILEFEQSRLGEGFDYKDYHEKLLGEGPLPFVILREKFGMP